MSTFKQVMSSLKRLLNNRRISISYRNVHSNHSATSSLGKSVKWGQNKCKPKAVQGEVCSNRQLKPKKPNKGKKCIDINVIQCGLIPKQKNKPEDKCDKVAQPTVKLLCTESRPSGCRPVCKNKSCESIRLSTSPESMKGACKDCKGLGLKRYLTHIDCHDRHPPECTFNCPGQKCKIYPTLIDEIPKQNDPCN